MRRSKAIHLILLPMLSSASASLASAQELGRGPENDVPPTFEQANREEFAPPKALRNADADPSLLDDEQKRKLYEEEKLTQLTHGGGESIVRGGFGSFFGSGG
jgi:hypothetical protein